MKKNEKAKKEDNNIENKDERNIFKTIILLLILAIAVCLLIARYVSTTGLLIKEYKIESNKLVDSYDGLKIVHFTDLHYGSTVGLKELANVVKQINKQKPDIVVFTGDLVEKKVVLSKEEQEKVIKVLKKLDPEIEILAVKGNHDYEHDYFDKFTKELEWHVLDNTYEYVYKNSSTPILFVGLDDYLLGKPDYDNAFSYLNEITEELYTIVLLHEPDQIDKIKNYDFDMALSGHSHLGQVRLPLVGAIYTPPGAKKYYDAHYKVNNADLYISGGIGTSTLKLRFLNRPSINLYRFYTK